jgi:hypothetical protein
VISSWWKFHGKLDDLPGVWSHIEVDSRFGMQVFFEDMCVICGGLTMVSCGEKWLAFFVLRMHEWDCKPACDVVSCGHCDCLICWWID